MKHCTHYRVRCLHLHPNRQDFHFACLKTKKNTMHQQNQLIYFCRKTQSRLPKQIVQFSKLGLVLDGGEVRMEIGRRKGMLNPARDKKSGQQPERVGERSPIL